MGVLCVCVCVCNIIYLFVQVHAGIRSDAFMPFHAAPVTTVSLGDVQRRPLVPANFSLSVKSNYLPAVLFQELFEASLGCFMKCDN